MDRLIGGSIAMLETSLRVRLTRQTALSANIANADTPGYRRVDIDFEKALDEATVGLERSHPRHYPDPAEPDLRLIRGPRGNRPDGNGVDREQELIQLTRNAGAFQDQAEVLARLFAMRRIAATGQV